MSSPVRRLVIVTVPLAPYRIDFYDGLAVALGPEWETSLIYGQEVPSDHAWTDALGKMTHAGAFFEAGSDPLRRLRGGKSNPRGPSAGLLRRLNELRPSAIVVAEFSAYCVCALLYGKLAGVPVFVQTEMGRKAPREHFGFWMRMHHWIWGAFVRGQLACSGEAREPINGSISQVCLTPHAVRAADYGPAPFPRSGRPVILVVGNLIPRKGLDLLAEACGPLVAAGLDFEIHLLGGGDPSWCRGHFEKAGLMDRVVFAGFREGADLTDYYRRASVFVLASRFDTYGVVTHEAAVSGLPLIISRWAGSSALLVEEGVNGFVVTPENTAEFGGRLKTLLSDADLRERMGRESRRLGEAFSVESISRKAAAFIRSLVR